MVGRQHSLRQRIRNLRRGRFLDFDLSTVRHSSLKNAVSIISKATGRTLTSKRIATGTVRVWRLA